MATLQRKIRENVGTIKVWYGSVRWVPGTLNRVENKLLEVLREGYRLSRRPPSAEPAISLDMADSDGIIQSSAGYDEELLERDPLGFFDPAFGGGYIGQLVIFTNGLRVRLRSAECLSDDDLEKIMMMIQPDRSRAFRRRIYSYLFLNEDRNGKALWSQIMDLLSHKGIGGFSKKGWRGRWLLDAFLSVAIGIYQLEKIEKAKKGVVDIPDLIYYKPGASFCGVEHYYGVRAVGIEGGVVKPLDIPPSQIVEPKDIWRFALVEDIIEVGSSKYNKTDLPKLIYPDSLHGKLGL